MTIALLITLSLTGATGQANWPGFLGGGPVCVQPAGLPLRWSPTENIAWQAPLVGFGQSSPVVWNGQVFVTSVEGPMKDTRHVLALDLASGQQRWKHSFESSDKVKDSNYVSRAAPTPVADDGGVYVFFESGDVVALAAGELDVRERDEPAARVGRGLEDLFQRNRAAALRV